MIMTPLRHHSSKVVSASQGGSNEASLNLLK